MLLCLSKLAAVLAVVPLAASFYIGPLNVPVEVFARDDGSCPINLPNSCTNSTPIADTCCFEAPGGVLLQTQFWDYNPAIGADDEFTLHGLWPDNCDGTYQQFCNSKLEILGSVENIIKNEFNDADLYSKMSKSWKSNNGDDDSLWEHEFNKHGTCINTISPKCYSNYKSDENIYDYFKIAVTLYEKLPTYKFLTEAGITPSTSKTYTKSQVAKALSDNFSGKQVYFKCDKNNALQEIWYFHHLQGSLRGENFKPIDTLSRSSCPDSGIKFLPKSGSNAPPNPPGNGDSSRGYIRLLGNTGCLISSGKYYESGTCATYDVAKLQFGGYTIKSSKGYCGIDANGDFNCNSSNQASKYQFQVDSNNQISYGGKSKWCFDDDNSSGSGNFAQTPITLGGNCDSPFTITLKSQ